MTEEQELGSISLQTARELWLPRQRKRLSNGLSIEDPSTLWQGFPLPKSIADAYIDLLGLSNASLPQ